MRTTTLIAAMLLTAAGGIAHAESDSQRAERLKWFTDARFGMFIHFGAYSLAARHEWVKNYENIQDAEYAKYVENFDPDLFDAREWVRAAKDAGMKYIVLTTKHHEGFCLFDSKYTDYKSTNTPFKRDIVKEFADACHEAGIRCGFYYSLLDWHHPDYTMDYWYPGCKGKTKAELAELNKGRDFSKYVDFLHNQVREILTNYGKVDILWYDFTAQSPGDPWWDTFKHTEDWKGVELMAMTRELQPGIVVNDRLGHAVPADVVTPEQQKTCAWPTHNGKPAPSWETCQTFSGSWGYYRDETTWKSVRQLLVMIIDNVSKGGNTILNVGPTGRGAFDPRAKDRLAGIGKWMKFNGRAIYGCGPAPEGIVAPEGTLLTYNKEKNRLYVHLVDYPIASLPIKFAGKVKYAQFLHDASEIKVKVPLNVSGFPRTDVDPSFILPVVKPDVEIPVIEVCLKDQVADNPVADALDRYVGAGRIAGVVSVLSDADYNEQFDCAGWADIEARRKMTPDTVFAIFSMTKTFTGAAIMCAIDEGKLSLDDEVAKYLPEFADVKMKETAERSETAEGRTKPKRALTLRDLTTHTTGFRSSCHVVDRDIPLREVARQLASQPLEFQPGETFRYGNAWIDTAAACLEVAVGEPYEKYLQRKVLDPLGMKDTTFWPNDEQLKRLVKAYNSDDTPLRPGKDDCTPQLEFPKKAKIHPSASGGLFSTPKDMIRFSQMLAHHGTWKDKTIISRKTFDGIFAVKQTPSAIDAPYTCGSWIYGDWFGHEGAMRTDQRANLKTGHSRVFFIQTENAAGSAFFQLKSDWHAACDKVQGTPPTKFGN